MKKMMIVALLMVISVTAKALSYEMARSEALFLSDKMAYELNLSPSQYEAIYEINLDYYLCVASSLDLYGDFWKQRNFAIQRVLSVLQYEDFLRLKYFYRPLGWRDGRWDFRVYRMYPNRSHFLTHHPRAYANYRGGRHFGARPGGPRHVAPAPRGDVHRGAPRHVAPAPRGDVHRGAPAPRGDMHRNAPAPRPNQMRGNGPAPGNNHFRGGNGGNRPSGPNGAARQQPNQRPQQAQRPSQGQRPSHERPRR